MCSACSGDYEDPEVTQYVPEEAIRLSPEQEECPHPEEGLEWDAYRGVFRCGECGAQLVIPELAEALDKKIL